MLFEPEVISLGGAVKRLVCRPIVSAACDDWTGGGWVGQLFALGCVVQLAQPNVVLPERVSGSSGTFMPEQSDSSVINVPGNMFFSAFLPQ